MDEKVQERDPEHGAPAGGLDVKEYVPERHGSLPAGSSEPDSAPDAPKGEPEPETKPGNDPGDENQS